LPAVLYIKLIHKDAAPCAYGSAYRAATVHDVSMMYAQQV